MEHLATLDAAFAVLDDEHNALNIASVGVFAGPALAPRDFAALYRRKLHLVPRLRQVVRPVPLGLARAAWVDDTAFDLRRHLRHTRIAAPARMSDLEKVVGEFVPVPLDPDRPLWQALLVDGLPRRQVGDRDEDPSQRARRDRRPRTHRSDARLHGRCGVAAARRSGVPRKRRAGSRCSGPQYACRRMPPSRRRRRGTHERRSRSAVHEVRDAASGPVGVPLGSARTAPTS